MMTKLALLLKNNGLTRGKQLERSLDLDLFVVRKIYIDKRDCLTTNCPAKIRTNCFVSIGFIYIKDIEKCRVNDFVVKYNRALHFMETTYMLVYQRNVSQV